MPKEKYDPPDPRRCYTIMSAEEAANGKKSYWAELEISGQSELLCEIIPAEGAGEAEVYRDRSKRHQRGWWLQSNSFWNDSVHFFLLVEKTFFFFSYFREVSPEFMMCVGSFCQSGFCVTWSWTIPKLRYKMCVALMVRCSDVVASGCVSHLTRCTHLLSLCTHLQDEWGVWAARYGRSPTWPRCTSTTTTWPASPRTSPSCPTWSTWTCRPISSAACPQNWATWSLSGRQNFRCNVLTVQWNE